MIVTELVYNSGKALQSLLGFIANQREQAIRVHINTQDEALFFLLDNPLHSPNDGSTLVEFREGFPKVLPADSQCDFQLTMDVADFSSLFAGAVSLKKLVLFGLAEISDEAWLDKADKTLSFHEKPQCFTGF